MVPSARDHPRGCGEKGVEHPSDGVSEGSSPRVRGEEHAPHFSGAKVGIIPAGAGRRNAVFFRNFRHGDHPRGCGEKANAPPRPVGGRGSSPRVRGEDPAHRQPHHAVGIIPAGAGRRRQRLYRGAPPGDHPRGCGEKSGPDRKGESGVGSSPRVRGEGASQAGRFCGAGSSPRVRGEDARRSQE